MGRYWNTYTSFSQPAVEVLRRKAQESVRDAQKSVSKYVDRMNERAKELGCQNTHFVNTNGLHDPEHYTSAHDLALIATEYFSNDLLCKVGNTPTYHFTPTASQPDDFYLHNKHKLINGEFPDELRDLFTGENGLFPSPREISFNCSCPDWALMCKHVAAAMYGIGVRFDENPFYFFHLRGIDVDRFIDVALENKVESMLRNAEQPSERIDIYDQK